MQNLRIVSVQTISSSSIDVTFTEALTPNLITSNISIIADTPNVPDSEVFKININGKILSITCQPLTPLAAYFLQFQSVPEHAFTSLNGDARISEDGVSNKFLITGPIESDNPVKNYLNSFFQDNIYRNDDETTVVSKYINSLSIALSRALYDIRQLKNENYLSFNIIDERKVRGEGPFDRLNEESAYELLRVGRTAADATASNIFIFDEFPAFPVTLQKQTNIETLLPNSIDDSGIFNINSLTLNLKNAPVTKIISIVFTLNTASPIFTYDIPTLGYQILNSRYDQDFAFSYLQLANNQVRLNDKILEDANFSLDNIIRVDVQYESKNLGIVVDASTVLVYMITDSIREILPPIINVFNLKHAPVTDANGNIPILNSITFTDPNTSISGAKHPAFITEIPFRLNALPVSPGQYSIDYNTGTVYVYGNDTKNDGTGPFPPLATYKYKLTYKSELDYVYDPDLLDIVALPKGNLIGTIGNISFDFEQVLIPGIDYESSLHREELTERIGNNLLALNVLKAKNSPITNVFRIFNETSGEIYTLDRWNNDKIYFRYNTPPRINAQTNERASFNTISNELLFVNTTLINTSSKRIFKFFLNNNSIIASSEDALASSFNTSMNFSNNEIFVSEKWFNNNSSESANIDRLLNVGEYLVDYTNGVIYCCVSSTQGLSLGTVTYKNNSIVPQFPHIIIVDDLYYRISILNPKNKQFSYVSFEDNIVTPEVLEPSDEAFLNNTIGAPYQLFNGSVGTFIDSSFISGVTNQINFTRSIFESEDLLNSIHPFNFSDFSTSSGFNINVSATSKSTFDNVKYNVTDGYFVLINENIPYLSPNITYTFNVVRTSDSLPLWNLSGVVVPGNPVKLKLSGLNSPLVDDLVNITYTIAINDLSHVIVDYNKGDYFIDYTYIADEIIISYEFGDNVIDFRTNTSLPANTEYFVSYKAGALRDALLKNFGTLVNIPELTNFDVDFDRERYRDALMAALTSFIQGPTLTAIKNIGTTISHIEPEIIESAFLNWSLGNSLLNPEPITTTGTFELLPGKFDNGVLINSSDQTIKFPINSNFRLEEGTFESWITPQWNGLDNDASLTFNILKDGIAIPQNKIFIGAAEYHPNILNGAFTLSKNSNVVGTPNTNKDGVFIYYDVDISGDFFRWYVRIIDGYVSPSSSAYSFNIVSTGTIYDSKSIILPKPSNLTTFTSTNSIRFSITSGGNIDEGITFLSDVDHYLLDFGESESKNRLSIYKDASGYINFRVFDRDKLPYYVSTDVSSWKESEAHHVSASWKLNTRNNRDEMHLFIDGFEVPNIIRYGQKLRPYLHEKYRTVDPEEIVGLVNRDIISSIDLHTTAGSTTVSSSINFTAYNIFAGDKIFIDEIGFDPDGYTILSVGGQTLILNATMPITLTNGRFSINRTKFTVTSDIDIAPNIEVTTIHTFDGYFSFDGYFVTGMDLTGTIGTNIVNSSAINFTTAGVLPGYAIRIDSISSPITYTILQVSGHNLTISDNLPIGLSGVYFQIYSNSENEIPGVRALRPSYSISKDGYFNNILTVSDNVFAGDLILVRTLGLNHKRIKTKYYVWSDDLENILMTRLPPPISLDEANITKIILPTTAIGPSNSTLILGEFHSNNLTTSQPVNSQNGRTISVTLSGNNVDFSSSVQVTINGVVGVSTVSETINFTDYGTLDFTNLYISINYINVIAKPINSLRNAVIIDVKEKHPITYSESSGLVPVIRFSYHIGGGYHLHDDGYGIVTDGYNTFSGLDINNYLVIHSPALSDGYPIAGFYRITGLSADRHSINIVPTSAGTPLPLHSFTNGIYQILNVSQYRSGFQNGFFTFEDSILIGQEYFLNSGFYELDYFTYARIKIDPLNDYVYIGSDLHGSKQLNSIVDQVKIYSAMLTDTRVGESIPSNQRSITKDFNSLKPLKIDRNTLVLINFNDFPFVNNSDFYINKNDNKHHFYSSLVVNENFGNSLVILDKPIIVSNNGILDTKKEGTIEFWVNTIFDTANDPNDRFYFDAFGAVLEDAVSTDSVSVKLSNPASQILNVKLKAGDPRIDYFAGGKLEIDTQHAIQENVTSIANSSVTVSKPILQVITVKIVGDLTGTDYFADGSISTDQKTIYFGKLLPASSLPLLVTYQSTENKNVKLNTQVIRLNKKLPNQNSHVIVNYIPKGLQGDRIAIFKDRAGFMNFVISASGTNYVLRAPTYWAKNTWHRVKASYKINSGVGVDEMRLFLDGYQYTNALIGSGILFGKFPIVWGSSMVGDGYGIVGNIRFKDSINDLFIGTDYAEANPIFSLIDNFRISNISRPLYAPYGESLDVNYSSNLSAVFPVTPDLFTTYLSDFDSTTILNEDFAVLKNRKTGSFDFSVNILDSFGIVNSSAKVKEVLEKLIKVLKPANSRVFIQYTR